MSAVKSNSVQVLEHVEENPSYKQMSDTRLILACQRKEHQAFNVLIHRHQRYIQTLIYNLAPDWNSCREDLIQDVLIRVWRSVGSLRNPEAFKGWLSRLCLNIFYDELRKRPSFSLVSMDEPLASDEEGTTQDIADISQSPDELMQRREIMEKVQEAIDLLPAQFKSVIILRELHGMPYEAIAAITKTEIGTVKSRIARARAKMQRQLDCLKCA